MTTKYVILLLCVITICIIFFIIFSNYKFDRSSNEPRPGIKIADPQIRKGVFREGATTMAPSVPLAENELI